MKLGEMIRDYRVGADLSLRAFAARCGLSPAYLSMLENGRNPKSGEPIKPSLATYRAIADAMRIPTGDLLSAVEDSVTLDDAIPFGTQQMPGLSRVPRLGAIACGEPVLAEQNIEGYDSVPDFVKCDFTLVCKGDSMTGARIYDGDIVCIKMQDTVESGQIAAVMIDDAGESAATLKRVRYIDGGIALWPENSAYSPLIYTGADANKVRVLGLATHFISRVV